MKNLLTSDIYTKSIKRSSDLTVSLFILITISPILILTALAIRISSEGPTLFTQQRLGLNGKTFKIYKFRTMTDKPRKPNGEIIGKHHEVTAVGYWLRRLKIDELPQLINILNGDMSLVGPRPALTEQLNDIKRNAPSRLSVKPGLTGLAQINGNIHLSWEERWLYDMEYVKNLSLALDFKIVMKTFLVIILGERIFSKKYTHYHEQKKS